MRSVIVIGLVGRVISNQGEEIGSDRIASHQIEILLRMELEQGTSKRLKAEVEILEIEKNVASQSQEMELHISQILEKMDNFTHLVSELLESGKTIFKELSNQFEDRMITLHKEQIEKWQDEIKQLRLLDASNEEAHALLHNAQFLLQNPHIDS